jgi:hypothetical protein
MSGAGILGFDKQFGQHVATACFPSLVVNSTNTQFVFHVPVGFGSVRIVGIEWVASAILSDADGTILLTVLARDISEAADDTLVASTSIEAGTALVPAALTLITEGTEKELTLDEGDSVRVTIVNNSAAIDTNGAVEVAVYYHSIPRETAGDDIKHASFYRA